MINPPPLSGRRAIVTGGNGGIGRRTCARLAELGASVTSFDLGHTGWPAALGDIATIDINLTEAIAVEQAVSDVGEVDILINSAGFYAVPRRPFWEIDIDEWLMMTNVNLTPTFLCSKAVSTGMRARGHGRIVNISSSTVALGMPNMLHYIAAKAGIVGMTRSMASELGAFGITVNAVAPGLVATPVALAEISPAAFAQAVGNQRVQQPISVDAVVSAITYFCMPNASVISGQVLLVNGGAAFGGI